MVWVECDGGSSGQKLQTWCDLSAPTLNQAGVCYPVPYQSQEIRGGYVRYVDMPSGSILLVVSLLWTLPLQETFPHSSAIFFAYSQLAASFRGVTRQTHRSAQEQELNLLNISRTPSTTNRSPMRSCWTQMQFVGSFLSTIKTRNT